MNNTIGIYPGENIEIIHPTVATDSNKSPKQMRISLCSYEIYDTLVEHCQSNIQYFGLDSNTVTGKRFLDAFRNVIEHIEIIRKYVTEIDGFLNEYDFDEMIPANGYRSLVKVTHEYIKHTIKVSEHIAENRGNLLFRKQAYVK